MWLGKILKLNVNVFELLNLVDIINNRLIYVIKCKVVLLFGYH